MQNKIENKTEKFLCGYVDMLTITLCLPFLTQPYPIDRPYVESTKWAKSHWDRLGEVKKQNVHNTTGVNKAKKKPLFSFVFRIRMTVNYQNLIPKYNYSALNKYSDI